MLLYKYRSLDELWYTLDIILNNQLRCSKWDLLNDPLEGRFEIFANFDSDDTALVNKKRDEWRICALSKSIDSFLLWSHYANGHKGIAIEVDIPESHNELVEVHYTPFTPLFTQVIDRDRDQRNLFEVKNENWEYEKEYRILCKDDFFQLPNKVTKIYLGPKVPLDQIAILESILPKTIELVRMKLDQIQGNVVPIKA